MIRFLKVFTVLGFLIFSIGYINNDNNKVLKVESNKSTLNKSSIKNQTKKRCKTISSNKIVNVSCKTIGINGYD